MEVVVSPESRGTVAEYCRKYTVGHGVRCGSRPGYRPCSCGDRAGVLPAPASGVTAFRGPCRSGSGVLQRWHSAGPAGQSLACSSGGGARSGPGPLGRSTGVHIRRSGRHVEVPDPSRGVRGSGCGRWAFLFEGSVATPDFLPSGRWARGHMYDEVESGRPELAE